MCNNSIVVRRTTTDYSGPINGLLFARVVAAPLTTPHVSSDRAAWRLPVGRRGLNSAKLSLCLVASNNTSDNDSRKPRRLHLFISRANQSTHMFG